MVIEPRYLDKDRNQILRDPLGLRLRPGCTIFFPSWPTASIYPGGGIPKATECNPCMNTFYFDKVVGVFPVPETVINGHTEPFWVHLLSENLAYMLLVISIFRDFDASSLRQPRFKKQEATTGSTLWRCVSGPGNDRNGKIHLRIWAKELS